LVTELAMLEPLERLLRPLDDRVVAAHVAVCGDCRRREELSAVSLLDLLRAPVVPVGLRHRVIHTGTDSELAGYRADIVARGGTLNVEGLPRQPDIPTHFAKRWLFAGGGMVGALVTAIIAAFLIGPAAFIPEVVWPSYQPQPSITPGSPPGRQLPAPTQAAPGGPPQAAVPSLHNPRGGATRPAPIRAGTLKVRPGTIAFKRKDNVAELVLSAVNGPVTWRAVSSSGQVTLSADRGEIVADSEITITVTFDRKLLQLPGKGTITITDMANQQHVVTVSWQGLLF
jgi:hypothetical protein